MQKLNITENTHINKACCENNELTKKEMVHCHIEVAKGQYKGKWYKNDKGVYCLYNSIKFYDAFFMDGVQLINVECDKFKYLETENLKEVVDNLKSQITELLSEIDVLKKNNSELETLINTQAETLSVKESTINALKNKLSEINKLSEDGV